MDLNNFPWELNPDLTRDRLTLLAQTITDTRHEALDEHDTNKGDGSWSYGCRCYERCVYRLAMLADQGEHPWLTVTQITNLKCSIQIGETLIRFYKGWPDNTRLRSLAQIHEELKQLSLPIESDESPALLWFLAIETLVDGEVSSISCIGITNSEQIVCSWNVPLKPSIPVMGNINATPAEAVEQHAPVVTVPDNFIERVRANE